MNYRQKLIRDMAAEIASLGFRVFVADNGRGEYGCYTDMAQGWPRAAPKVTRPIRVDVAHTSTTFT